MSNFTLRDLVRSSGAQMRLDLAERLVAHRGELGMGREEIVRQFLRAYLPKRFDVSTGFVFDSTGRISGQMDVIIANSQVCPRFETAGGNRYYPCESIVAVAQVKTSITSRSELRSALDNLASAKALDRSAGGRAIDVTFGETIDNQRNHLHQIFSFLFIIDKSLTENTAGEVVMEYILSQPVHTWPNVILALDKYLITYCCDSGVCANPMHSRGIAVQQASQDEDVLLRLYLLLGQAVDVTRVSALPYWDYLQGATQWSAKVYFSCTDDPPPYLGSITAG